MALSCIFHDHDALTRLPADSNRAVIFQGSNPRRVALQDTDSMPIPAAASVRSMSSETVCTRESLGAGSMKNCSIAYCFSVSTPLEKRLTSVSLRP